MTQDDGSKRSSLDKTGPIELVEAAPLADSILERYALLREKSPDELAALNKSVLKKLDWKFLPCITAMLLMKYVPPYAKPNPPSNTLPPATSTASTSPTPVSLACKNTATCPMSSGPLASRYSTSAISSRRFRPTMVGWRDYSVTPKSTQVRISVTANLIIYI